MKRTHSAFRRSVATLLATLLCGPFSPMAIAQTALSDVPIASKVTAKPNIVYTVDDSGSMSLPYIPDFTWKGFCRSGTATANCLGSANTAFALNTPPPPPLLASDFNHLAYNPDVTYTPPLLPDGSILAPFVNQDAAGTSNWTQVQVDPYLTPATKVNFVAVAGGIAGGVTVPLYCNSDWPLDTTLHPKTSGGQTRYDQDSGNGHCRINGTSYPADIPTGSPNIIDDYNYPWQNASLPSGAQYFFRGAGAAASKTIWCDVNNAGWPSVNVGVGACVTSCQGGVPIKSALITQTWTWLAHVTACTGTTVWTPAGCNTNTAYCAPGASPLSPPECTPGCGSSCSPITTTGERGQCSYVDPASGKTVVTNSNSTCAGAGCIGSCPNLVNSVVTGCTGGTLKTSCACAANNAGCTCTDPVQGQSYTLLQDSNLTNGGTGAVCRHNNQAYGATPASPVTYGTVARGGMTPWNTAVTTGCGTFAGTVTIPRHYYTVDSVQFCKNPVDATVNGQWKGFGVGPCQTKNDFTTYFNVKYGQFHRVDLVNDGRTFAYTDIITKAPGTRVFAQEMTNYANWYAFYRTRILAAKTTSATAFAYLDKSYRVGFHTFNTPGTAWLNISDFDTAQRTAWNAKLFAINVSTGNTPTLDALLRIGNLYQTGGSGGLPALASGTLPVGVADPVTLSCQSNFHVLFTDGATQQASAPVVGAISNYDANEPASFPAPLTIDNTLPQITTRLPGGPWYAPFKENAVVPNSLADIALYYWATDLRPAMKNDVPAWPGTTTAPFTYPKKEGDGDWETDVAWWQHQNFSAISFGAEGILDAQRSTAEVVDIMNGVKSWPSAAPPNFPAPNSLAAVDDLWHATVNSRGKFVYAQAPIEVAQGLASILAGISNSRKGRVGATFGGSQVLDPLNDTVYRPTIEAGWGGNLIKTHVDPATVATTATDWQARTTLATQLAPTVLFPEPWFTDRRIVTMNTAGTPVAFRHPTDPGPGGGNLDATQLLTFSPDPLQQRKITAYLRGGSTFGSAPAVQIEGTSIGQFRKRSSLLGDINQSQPVIVGAPPSEVTATFPPGAPIFSDTTDPGFNAFWTAKQTRATRVYVGANDGMLHSFDANDGHEVFAYVPRAVIRNTKDANLKPDGIQALTYQDGGVPIFHKHSYVDGPITVADVDFGGSNWHTILVGGLGKGGNSFYALDVTDPDAADETAATGKVLWEFTDPDMAYSYSKPIIAKTYAFGWTVIVAAGYNNPSGLGKIFFINPRTGAKMATLSTGFGSAGAPSGLAQIAGFTKDYHNQFVEQIYGGDLYGNVWRFDVSAAGIGAWSVTKIATLTAFGGGVQPVTIAPQIEIDFANGQDRYVFVGTGQLLDISDFTTPTPQQQQTMYAIRDGTIGAVETVGLPRTRATLGVVPDMNGLTVPSATGWLFDLPTGPTERIVTPLEADLNVVAFAGTQAQNDPCATSLPASLYALEFASGRSVLESGGAIVPSIPAPEGAVGVTLVSVQTSSPGSVPTLKLVYTPEQVDKPIVALDLKSPVVGGGHRFSIRYLSGQ